MTPHRSNEIDVFAITADWAKAHDIPLWSADVTSSTNSVAKSEIDDELFDESFRLAEQRRKNEIIIRPSLYLARRQTLGRGRDVNRWENAPGQLLSSWSFWLHKQPQPILSPLVGLSVFSALAHTFPAGAWSMKAPNDVYLGDKKVAGILIESVAMRELTKTVIGIGINVNQRPEKISTATAISQSIAVDDSNWRHFLDGLYGQLIENVRLGLDRSLDLEHREKIRNALNLFPLLDEPILEVDALAQLRTATRRISWTDL